MGFPIDNIAKFMASIALRNSRPLDRINLDLHFIYAIIIPCSLKQLFRILKKIIFCSLFIRSLGDEIRLK